MADIDINTFSLSPEDELALAQVVFGEAANQDYDTMKMVGQSVINRYMAKRKKEFGKTIPEIINKGYYAAKNRNSPYKQALSGVFNDEMSKQKWSQAQQAVSDILSNQDFGNVMFYFTPDEITKQTKAGTFDFNLVKPFEDVGIYKTFAYPKKARHYKQ